MASVTSSGGAAASPFSCRLCDLPKETRQEIEAHLRTEHGVHESEIAGQFNGLGGTVVACGACGSPIARSATKCENCGAKTATAAKSTRLVIALVAVGVVAIAGLAWLMA